MPPRIYCGSHATASSKIRAETSPFIINPKSDNLNIVSKLFESIQFLDFDQDLESNRNLDRYQYPELDADPVRDPVQDPAPHSSDDFSDSSDSLPDVLYFNL